MDENNESFRWWDSKEDPHNGIFAASRHIYDQDDTRRDELLHHIRLYGHKAFADLFGDDAPIGESIRNATLRYNAVKAVIDTAVSRIGKNRPRAHFLTQGGDYTLQRQSRRLSKYVEGAFYEMKMYDKGRMAFRDACIGDSGLVKFYEKRVKSGWKVWCDRVFPWEVLVDRVDARGGEPQTIYHMKFVDKRMLEGMISGTDGWKTKAQKKRLRELIDEADAGEIGDMGRDTLTDPVQVVEVWRLPTSPDAGDGKHVMAISSATLFQEEWDEDWFPFAWYSWSQPLFGVWGSGITRQINGIQVEINRLLSKIQRAYNLFANPWVAIQVGSKVTESHITNELGRIIKYVGAPPVVVTHSPINDQIFGHLGQLKVDAFELPGVSQFAAQGRKPADLESGEALRQFNEIEDVRHADPALAYEMFYMDAARIVVGMSRRMAKAGREPSVMAHFKRRSRKWVEPIAWNEVNLEESTFVMQVYPTSILPSTPTGRTATIQSWMRSGLIEQQTAMYLLEIPDTEDFLNRDLANVEIVLDALEGMIDDKEPRFLAPEPYQDLVLARELATAGYLRAKIDRVPEERLKLVRRYISSIDRLAVRATEEAAAAVEQEQALAGPDQQTQGGNVTTLPQQGPTAVPDPAQAAGAIA